MLDDTRPRCDPLVDWDMRSASQALEHDPLPLLLLLRPGWREPGSLLDRIAAPIYRSDERCATVRVGSLAELQELRSGASSRWIERIASARIRGTRTAPLRKVSVPAARDKLRGTVIAVIDDCCAFGHERFRFLDAQGVWRPRIRALWDQGNEAGDSGWWREVAGFGYGREMDGETLGRLMSDPRCSDAGIVDEDRLYAIAGQSGMEQTQAHGTHVLDLAAGADPRDAASADAPQIVFVQLPQAALSDTSGHWLSVYAIDALRYVHERVDATVRLVVNLSYGALAGPHDGSQAIEQAIEHLHALRPHNYTLVLPAGNGFSSGCHASGQSAGEPVEFVLSMRHGDPTESFVDVWSATPVRAEFRVQAPDGTVLDAARPLLLGTAGEPLAQLLLPDQSGASRAHALLCMAPTLGPQGSGNRPLIGRWRISATARASQPTRFDAWIERDEPVRGPNHPQAWQATFVEAAGLNARVADGQATLNSIANGPSPIVVGACENAAAPRMCEYSGSGWHLGQRAGPDVAALGDEAPGLPGISAAGTRSAYRFRMRGTSVAAPQVARWVAAWLTRQPEASTIAQIKEAVRREAATHAVFDPHFAAAGRAGAGFLPPAPTTAPAATASTAARPSWPDTPPPPDPSSAG